MPVKVRLKDENGYMHTLSIPRGDLQAMLKGMTVKEAQKGGPSFPLRGAVAAQMGETPLRRVIPYPILAQGQCGPVGASCYVHGTVPSRDRYAGDRPRRLPANVAPFSHAPFPRPWS